MWREKGGRGAGERFSDMTNPNATISAFSPTELGRTRLLVVVVIAVKCIAVIGGLLLCGRCIPGGMIM